MTSEHTLSDREARLVASDWHGGQWSPLYALASTGAIVDGVVAEIGECLFDESTSGGQRELYALATYAAKRGPRGPQAGWIDR